MLRKSVDKTITDAYGMEIFHHFSDNEYAKEVYVPQGVYLKSHKHKFSHLSILCSGTAEVEVDGKSQTYEAPTCLNIAAGCTHKVTAITNIVWFCIHATQEKNVDKIEGDVIE